MPVDLLELRNATRQDLENWDKVVLESEDGTFFHTTNWLGVITGGFEKGNEWVPNHLSIIDTSTEDLVGVFPCFIGKTKMLYSSPHSDYGGLCVLSGFDFDSAVREIDDFSKKRTHQLCLITTNNRYKRHGFSSSLFAATFELDIADITLEHLWKNVWTNKTRRRQCISKAKRSGIEIGFEEDLSAYYEMYVDTMKRLDAETLPFSFFEGMSRLLKDDVMKILLARKDGRPIAGLLFFHWKEHVHLWGNVSLSEYHRYFPNDYLIYSAIKWAIENKFKRLDFGMTDPDPSSGHYIYKSKWGGNTRPIYKICKLYMRNIPRYALNKIGIDLYPK